MSPGVEALSESISLREILILLTTAAIIVPLFYRLRISPVLGYIMSGIILGPHVLGSLSQEYELLKLITIKDKATIHTMADLGVMFLLFAIGLELSFERLIKMRRVVFLLGGLQVSVSTLTIAIICLNLFEITATASVIIGLALSLSSTAIVMQVLAEKKRMLAPEGRATFGVLLFQDIAIIPILFAVSFLAPDKMGLGIVTLIKALVISVVAVVAVISVGRLIIRPLFTQAAAINGPEIFMAASFLVIILTGLATNAAGLSMTLGAFLAGILLAETEFRREVEATIQPFKGLLLGVFLVSVGMSVDIGLIAERPLPIIGAVAALIAVKAMLIGIIGPVFKLDRKAAIYSGLLLGSSGEFAFVVIGLARNLEVVGPRSSDFALTVAGISMCLIPIIAEILELSQKRKGKVSSQIDKVSEDYLTESDHVIVAGFGRVGNVVVEMLESHNVPYIAIDNNLGMVGVGRTSNKRVYFGDISKPDFLKACAIERARAVVITVSGEAQVNGMVQAIYKVRPDVPVVVRAKDGVHAQKLYELGVTEAVPETLEASLHLGEAILVEAGVAMGNIIVSVHEKRAQMREELLLSSSATTPSERLRGLRRRHENG